MVATFEYQTDFLMKVLEDTVFVEITSMMQLMHISQLLYNRKYVFVVSPAANELACSRQAAQEIGLL